MICCRTTRTSFIVCVLYNTHSNNCASCRKTNLNMHEHTVKQKQQIACGQKPTKMEYDRYNYFDTKDYWLAPNRWKNSVCDCESDVEANVDSDNFPLIMEIQTKLKAKSQKRNEPTKNSQKHLGNKGKSTIQN